MQAQWHSTHQMLEDELSRMQHLASEQTLAQQTAYSTTTPACLWYSLWTKGRLRNSCKRLLGNKKCTWRSWQQQRKSLPNFGLIGLRPLRGRLRLRLLDC